MSADERKRRIRVLQAATGESYAQAARRLAETETFEKVLMRAYIEAVRAIDPTTVVLSTMGCFSYVVLVPLDREDETGHLSRLRSAQNPYGFVSWLVEERIAVTTADGAAALPYGGSHRQATVLGYSLMINAGVGFTITEGEEPPPSHWERLEELREGDRLPAVLYSDDPMPEYLADHPLADDERWVLTESWAELTGEVTVIVEAMYDVADRGDGLDGPHPRSDF